MLLRDKVFRRMGDAYCNIIMRHRDFLLCSTADGSEGKLDPLSASYVERI